MVENTVLHTVHVYKSAVGRSNQLRKQAKCCLSGFSVLLPPFGMTLLHTAGITNFWFDGRSGDSLPPAYCPCLVVRGDGGGSRWQRTPVTIK